MIWTCFLFTVPPLDASSKASRVVLKNFLKNFPTKIVIPVRHGKGCILEKFELNSRILVLVYLKFLHDLDSKILLMFPL